MSPIDPDCSSGKHRACPGWTWDEEKDGPGDCSCLCHEKEEERVASQNAWVRALRDSLVPTEQEQS